MPFDAKKNLAIALITTAPSPATTGTTLSVEAGKGVRFPAAPFNATVWPKGVEADPSNAEIVRVTAVATDAFTIVRAQEGSTARAIISTDQISATVTAKSLTDIETTAALKDAANNFAGGDQTISGGYSLIINSTITIGTGVKTATLVGADNRSIMFASHGGAFEDAARGASIIAGGVNTNPGFYAPGLLSLTAGNVATGLITFNTGNAVRGTMHQSGGFSWGNAVDPGAGNFSVVGNIAAANLKWQQGLTWGLVGDLSALTTLPLAFVPEIGTQACRVAGIRTKIESGTSIGVQVKRNGTNVGGLITVTTSSATTTLNQSLNANDGVTLVLSSPVGTPTTLSATLYLEHAL